MIEIPSVVRGERVVAVFPIATVSNEWAGEAEIVTTNDYGLFTNHSIRKDGEIWSHHKHTTFPSALKSARQKAAWA